MAARRGDVIDGRLVRLGYGVYARAIVSRLSGEPLLYSRNGLSGAARQALDKLGVKWEPTESERAYCQRRRDSRPAWRSKSRPVAGRMRRHSKGPDRAPLRAGCENFR